MKKWLIRICAGLSSLTVLLFLCGFYLLATETGTNFLISQAEKQLNGALHIGTARGKVLDHLELTDIVFKSPTSGTATLDSLVFNWKSSDLFHLHLHIVEISANNLSYTASLKTSELKTTANAPLTLPTIHLPFTVTVENLTLHNVSFSSAPDAEPLSVKRANLSLIWNTNGIELQNLHVTMAEGSLACNGTIDPTGNYPLQLTSTLTTQHSTLPALVINGAYSGDLQDTLILKEELRGDINADIQMTVQDILNRLSYQGDLAIEKLPLELFSPDTPGIVTGTVHLQGTMNTYQLTVKDAAIAGSKFPEGTIQLTTQGDLNGVNNLVLQAELLEGTIKVLGNVQWTPALSWQLETTGTTINPGLYSGDWPGKLGWLIQSKGHIADSGIVTDTAIQQLEGTLRGFPISGGGKIAVKAEDIRVNDLHLSSGSSVFSASGNLGRDSGLLWNMEVSDFSDLIPQASGQFHAKGSIQGEMNSPQIELQLSGATIAVQDISLETLQADASLDLRGQNPFTILISGTNLKSGENLLEQLALQGNGTRERHNLSLLASHSMADISLALQGGYLDEQWLGAITQLDIISGKLGTWRSQKATTLSATATSVSLDTLCLNRSESTSCLNGSWDAEKKSSKAEVEVSKVPLAWLSPWFPDTLESLSGSFSAKASGVMNKELKADISATITPGEVVYLTDKNKGSLPHEGMQLDLHILEESVNAELSLGIDSNTVKGNLNSPDLLKPHEMGNAKLDGALHINAKKFDLVEALVPSVHDLNAAVDVDLKIEGTPKQPDINGKGQINISSVFIPEAGLELKDTTMNILANNRELQLHGTFKSPDGFMDLDGKATLDGLQNWPLRLTLKGNNFRLLNLPEVRLFLSSDLLLERKDDTLNLSGEASIAKAEVLLRQVPQGSQTSSPDVVIIQEEKTKEEKTLPLHMKLKVTLGDDVHFAGFGLNAFIDGQLLVLSEPDEQMLGSGAFHIKQGSFRAYGQNLDIETGVISFPGTPLSQPGINLRATRSVGGVVAGISAIGPARKPRVTTFSTPPMSESQVIAYLITGSAPGDVGKGTKLSIGRQINNKLSVSVGTDVKTGDSEFITRYRLSRTIHVQTTTAANGNAADIFYTVEFGGEEEETKEGTEKKLYIPGDAAVNGRK